MGGERGGGYCASGDGREVREGREGIERDGGMPIATVPDEEEEDKLEVEEMEATERCNCLKRESRGS